MAPMIMTLSVWRNEPISTAWSDLTIPTSSHNKWPSFVEWLAACSSRRCFLVILLYHTHSHCLVRYFVSCSKFKVYPSANQTKQRRETWRLYTDVVGTIHIRTYQGDLLAIDPSLYIYDEMPWWCFNSNMTSMNMQNGPQMSPDLWKEPLSISILPFPPYGNGILRDTAWLLCALLLHINTLIHALSLFPFLRALSSLQLLLLLLDVFLFPFPLSYSFVTVPLVGLK